MEVEHKPAQESDTQTSPVLPNIHIRSEMYNTVESTEIKQEPKFHLNDNLATFDENSKYSGDMGIRVDVKTEVSDCDECEHTDNIHKSPHGGDASYVNGNYVGRDLICNTNVPVVKSEPADEFSATTDNTFIIEIDTCKDEYYERHGYPTNDVTANRDDKSHNCHVCERNFNHKGHLTDHMRTHTGEKPHTCSVCGIGFGWKFDLTRHTRIHTGEKPHKCSICDVNFTEKGTLTTHMRTHTSEKPYKCSVCGGGFTQTGTLKTHMRKHTGEKPHKCSVCESSFTTNSKLIARIHTGEKPYKCSVCGVAFTHAIKLRRHTVTHSVEKPHICSMCGIGFSQKSDLSKHAWIHTRE